MRRNQRRSEDQGNKDIMKRLMAVVCITLMLSVSIGCGSGKTIKGEYHDTVGVFTLNQKDPNACYEVIFGNVVWSFLLIETLIMPVYFIGWSIMEPVKAGPCNQWGEE